MLLPPELPPLLVLVVAELLPNKLVGGVRCAPLVPGVVLLQVFPQLLEPLVGECIEPLDPPVVVVVPPPPEPLPLEPPEPPPGGENSSLMTSWLGILDTIRTFSAERSAIWHLAV